MRTLRRSPALAECCEQGQTYARGGVGDWRVGSEAGCGRVMRVTMRWRGGGGVATTCKALQYARPLGALGDSRLVDGGNE